MSLVAPSISPNVATTCQLTSDAGRHAFLEVNVDVTYATIYGRVQFRFDAQDVRGEFAGSAQLQMSSKAMCAAKAVNSGSLYTEIGQGAETVLPRKRRQLSEAQRRQSAERLREYQFQSRTSDAESAPAIDATAGA